MADESKTSAIDDKCVNTIRVLAADTVQGAKSGHPGAPMGCAPMAHVLWGQVMNYSPSNTKWANRDRFVLSNGHACALLYTMMHLTGYDLSMDDLKAFRQLGSKTPGHPENHLTDGVEVSTGPLGQGISNAVGLALAQANLAAKFNEEGFAVSDNFTYVICGDGCLQEGVSSEACSLAGHLGLGRLIVLYDDNKITIDGSTDLSFTEDVLKRYEAYGWHTQTVEDGNTTPAGIAAAVKAAREVTDKPSLIKISTVIGYGSGKAGSHKVHGSPLGEEDLSAVKAKFGFDPAVKYTVSDDVYAYFRAAAARGAAKEAEWNTMMEAYAKAHPAKAAEFQRRFGAEGHKLPEDWAADIPTWSTEDGALATRKSSAAVLNALAKRIPELVGGSADLSPSNYTELKGDHDFQKDTPDGRYIRFGVREHGMTSICNGIAAFGGFVPFCATFLNFCGYALGAVRVTALSHFRVLFVFTHDSIGLGEDGPTHQPVEMLISLRAMPNMTVFRPADATEVAGAYRWAVAHSTGPSALALSRQGLPNLAGSSADGVAKGAYVLCEEGEAKAEAGVDLVIAATGSEVKLAVDAAAAIPGRVRIVSMPSLDLYDAQSPEYKRSLFPAGVPVLSVEAASTAGWSKYAHASIGIDTFGVSAKGADAFKHFGFTADNVAAKAQALLDFYSSRPLPDLLERPF